MHSAEDIWRDLALPLPSFADLVRSYAPLVRGYPEFDPDEPRDESGRWTEGGGDGDAPLALRQ
jgi:hypothetical protein